MKTQLATLISLILFSWQSYSVTTGSGSGSGSSSDPNPTNDPIPASDSGPSKIILNGLLPKASEIMKMSKEDAELFLKNYCLKNNISPVELLNFAKGGIKIVQKLDPVDSLSSYETKDDSPDDNLERLIQGDFFNLWYVFERSFNSRGNPSVPLIDIDLLQEIAANDQTPTLEVAPFGSDHYCKKNCVFLNPMDMGAKVDNDEKEIRVERGKMLYEWVPNDPQQKYNLIIGENLIINDKDIAKLAELLSPHGKAYLSQVGLNVTEKFLAATSKIFHRHHLKITPIKHKNPKSGLDLVGYQVEHFLSPPQAE